ncbi:hypothetical protein FACS1894181_05000 [Bacteroidia bacterium]|nr:hypothetical protein FACS1894181_05000 [Bacteroidia bacterium]
MLNCALDEYLEWGEKLRIPYATRLHGLFPNMDIEDLSVLEKNIKDTCKVAWRVIKQHYDTFNWENTGKKPPFTDEQVKQSLLQQFSWNSS